MKSYLKHLLLTIPFVLGGCSYMSQGMLSSNDRDALPAGNDFFGDRSEKIVYLDQNWDSTDSLWFYNTTQGSNLMPLDIFLQLEQADKTDLFRSEPNMRKYRYLTQTESWDNEHALPVGFVADTYRDKEYLGFTCAACHTSQINYNGYGMRIDGAPALADMGGMLGSLQTALEKSLSDTAKFERLANIISTETGETKEQFKTRLTDTTKILSEYNRVNISHTGSQKVDYGYGRLDAFGRIYNRALSHMTPGKDNFNSPNAPVSYPFLWDTPQHDFVQWNGVGDNSGAGPLGRNTGEVLGVFATFDLKKHSKDLGYRSSVDARNLVRLERHLFSLESPLWPEVLPAVDTKLAQQGKEVFVEYRCHQCHEDINRSDGDRKIIAQFSSLELLGTDTTMANNAFNYTGKSGVFEGDRVSVLDKDSGHYGPETKVLPALTTATLGVVAERDHDKSFVVGWALKIYDLTVAIFDNPVKDTKRHQDFEIVDKADLTTLLAYKGRPLNGIWATAPYLHNGSVQNLYELFLPSCTDAEVKAGKTCRANDFTMGSREFDPVKVGFKENDITKFPGLFNFNTRIPGNLNTGHEYAVGKTAVIKLDDKGKAIRKADGKFELEWLTPINEVKRVALVEYLKTL